jgi:hypothetical protein
MSPAVAKRTALQQYLHTFFGGSLRQMMTALVREGSWDDEDLDALKVEIERARKGRKQSRAPGLQRSRLESEHRLLRRCS